MVTSILILVTAVVSILIGIRLGAVSNRDTIQEYLSQSFEPFFHGIVSRVLGKLPDDDAAVVSVGTVRELLLEEKKFIAGLELTFQDK